MAETPFIGIYCDGVLTRIQDIDLDNPPSGQTKIMLPKGVCDLRTLGVYDLANARWGALQGEWNVDYADEGAKRTLSAPHVKDGSASEAAGHEDT